MKFITNLLSKMNKYLLCKRYYQLKRKNSIRADLYVPEWRVELYKEDVGRERITFKIGTGDTLTAEIVGVKEPGKHARGVYLNIEYINNEEYIHKCDWGTFNRVYSDVIKFLADRDFTVDVLNPERRY